MGGKKSTLVVVQSKVTSSSAMALDYRTDWQSRGREKGGWLAAIRDTRTGWCKLVYGNGGGRVEKKSGAEEEKKSYFFIRKVFPQLLENLSPLMMTI